MSKLKSHKWKYVTLGEISLKFINGGTPLTSNPNYWNGQIPWIRSAWIKKKYVDSGERFITDQGLKNSSSNVIPKNNVIVATRVSLGNVVINKVDVAINQDLTGIILDKTKANEEFVYFSLAHDPKKITSLSQGSTIQGITRKQLENILIPLPSLQTQIKIVTILSNVENLIGQYGSTIEFYKNLKKGLTQKLLTKGIGHKKFKKVKSHFGKYEEIPEEWEKSNIGINTSILLGYTFPSLDYSKDENDVKLLRGDNVTEGNIRWGERTRYWKNIDSFEKYQLQENDFVISMDGSKVGKNYAYVRKEDLPCLLLQRVACLRAKPTMIQEYYGHIFGNKKFLNYVNSIKTNSAIPHISATDIQNFEVFLPSISEQQQISTILDSISFKISNFEYTKSFLENLKKGLMQKLLTGELQV